MILWTLKWTKHHWFLECGLGCCTSNLKIDILDFCAFMSKIPIYAQNYPCFMILLVSSHIYVLFFKTFPCSTLIYIFYWPYTKIHRISSFWVISEVSGTVEAIFTRHIWLLAWTCLGFWFPRYIRAPLPLRTLGFYFNFHSISCSGKGLSRRFRVSSTKSLWFLGDLTPLLLKTFKPKAVSLLRYSLMFSLVFFDVLLISFNVRSLCHGAPLGCRNHALNLVWNQIPCLANLKTRFQSLIFAIYYCIHQCKL
jgi:hypothetical protein